MRINTKAIFQWDGKEYVEIYTEGYEYHGPLSLADEQDDIDQLDAEDEENNNNNQTGPTMAELYGVGLGTFGDESDLFTKISQDLVKGTKRGTYDAFFGMKQQGAESQFLSQTSKIGQTQGGQAMGFAGSTAQNISMDQRKDAYGQSVVATEQEIQGKQSQSRNAISQIVAGNKSTLLSLKQMEDANNQKGFWKTAEKPYYGQKKGTGWICNRLRKEGVVTLDETLKMTRFFIKFLFKHPALAELYVSHSRQLIKKADNKGFKWSDPRLKYDFITRVLSLSDSGMWDMAYMEYFNSYMNLCGELHTPIDYDKKLWNIGFLGSFKYWFRMFKQKFFRESFFSMLYISYKLRGI